MEWGFEAGRGVGIVNERGEIRSVGVVMGNGENTEREGGEEEEKEED